MSSTLAAMPAATPHPRGLSLTARDLDFACDLLRLRFAPTPCAYVLGVSKTNGTRWQRRLTKLVQAGFLHRFKLARSPYLHGKDFALYTLETGVATRVSQTGRGRWAHTDADWQTYVEETRDLRDQLVEALGSRGLDSDRVRAILAKNEDIACKIVFGESSQVQHLVLAATLVTLLVHAARAYGLPIDAWEPDGMADLSFPMTVTEKSGKPHQTTVPCRPDALLVIAGQAIAVEAETGFSSRAKVAEKIARYTQLLAHHGLAVVAQKTGLPVVKSLRVVFYCATPLHAQMVTEEIRRACPQGTGLFLVVDQTAVHLAYSADQFDAGKTAEIPDLYGHLATRVTAPLFVQVEGTVDAKVDGQRLPQPKKGYTPLLAV